MTQHDARHPQGGGNPTGPDAAQSPGAAGGYPGQPVGGPATSQYGATTNGAGPNGASSQHGAPQHGAPQHGGAPAYDAQQAFTAPPQGGAPAYGAPAQGGGQQAYGAQPAHGAPQQAPTGDGLEPNVGALIAYLTWIGGLIMFLTQKHREVRFHAAQCILLSIVVFVIYMGFFIISLVPLVGLIMLPIEILFGLGLLALWIFLMVKAYNLVHFKLPVIGNMAEKWAAS